MPFDSTTANTLMSIRECNNPRLEEHMCFICPECGKKNDTQQEWRRHLNMQHAYATKTAEDFDFKEIDDRYHECQICMKWVANAHQAIALLQYHRFLHLPYPKTYSCKHCSGSFTRKRALCDHLNRFHYSLINKLNKERKMQELKRTFEEQNPKYNKEFYIKCACPLCGKIFNKFNMWQQHIDAAHSATSVDLRLFRIQSTKNYYCTQCCQTIKNCPTKSQLQRHHFTHLPNPKCFQCSYCSTRKSYKSELLIHLIESHRQVFEKYREYIQKPIEWGGQADEKIIKELNRLLEEDRNQQTDILQKAIQESLIDLEDEVEKDSIIKFNHEHALDQSLKELDEILNSEIDPNLQLKVVSNPSDNELDDDELEELCEEIFEVVHEQHVNISPQILPNPNKKRLKLNLSTSEIGLKLKDSQQIELQKYINYICPECGNEFDSQSVWRSHVFEQHNLSSAVEKKFRAFNSQKTSYICLACFQVLYTSRHSELRRHHFQHMPYQAYLKCTICTKTKSSKPKMLQHLQNTHLEEIQKNSVTTRNVVNILRCLECDRTFTQQTRFKNHCLQCPQRLQPLAVGQYDIAKNMKLLEHLHKASRRIEKLLRKEGLDVKSLELPYKQ